MHRAAFAAPLALVCLTAATHIPLTHYWANWPLHMPICLEHIDDIGEAIGLGGTQRWHLSLVTAAGASMTKSKEHIS